LIVFASNRGAPPVEGDIENGQYEVYTQSVNGGELRRLTQVGQCDDRAPIPSPDGGEVAFVRDCPRWYGEDLMVVSSGGGQPTTLATRVDTAAWSPDGRLIAFTRVRDPLDPLSEEDLWVVAADGGHLRRVAEGQHGWLSGSVGAFAWSHDGGQIAFGCQGGSLCVANMRTGTVRRLHRFSADNDVSSLAWSRDDEELALVDGSGGSYNPDYSAWIMARDGEHTHRLPRYGEGNVDALEWLPNRPQEVVVETDVSNVYLVRVDGTHKHDLPVEVDDAGIDCVSASADGSKLLFVRTVFGGSGDYYYRSAIWRANLKTGQIRQLTQRASH
jgi:Tol biopolymer transport system component